ncbi:MAG: MBL fold metallo-hydrolase [Leptospirales bacterium]|nr:MBL fold metallo-hydrolase [Leptospirales bacterium]
MNRVRVIGSGNAFNMDGRAHACYLLEDRLLLDCGAASLLRLNSLEVDLGKLDGLLLTHFHGDHFAGLPFLLLTYQYVLGRTRPFVVLGPAGLRDACRALLDLTYPGVELSFPVEYRELESNVFSHFSGFDIFPMPVTHKKESVGYRIKWNEKTFAFSGDSAYDSLLFDLVHSVDLAIVELSMYENDGSVAHVALSQIRDGSLQAKRIVFTHVFNRLAESARAEQLEVAEDGNTYEF